MPAIADVDCNLAIDSVKDRVASVAFKIVCGLIEVPNSGYVILQVTCQSQGGHKCTSSMTVSEFNDVQSQKKGLVLTMNQDSHGICASRRGSEKEVTWEPCGKACNATSVLCLASHKHICTQAHTLRCLPITLPIWPMTTAVFHIVSP